MVVVADWESRVLQLAGLVGRPVADDAGPHVEYATVDSIRHFARAYGDGNPLYSDPAYATAGPRQVLVAPPLFPIASGVPLGDDGAPVDISLPGSEPTVVADTLGYCYRAIDRHAVAAGSPWATYAGLRAQSPTTALPR